MTEQNKAVEATGLFERTVSHEQARQSAQNLIDAFFNNRNGKGVLVTVPARPDNDDVQLVDYIKQQAALSRPTQTADAVVPFAWLFLGTSGTPFWTRDAGEADEWRELGWVETPLYASPPTPTHDSGLAGELLDEMVNRFLMWKLPENFSPDAGITFEPEYNAEYMATLGKPPMRHEPVGTNLFDFDQAKAMVLHILGDDLTALQSNSDSELLREALLDAAVAFELYADNHTAKANLGPKSERAERTEKANRNTALGKQMRQALARLEQGAA